MGMLVLTYMQGLAILQVKYRWLMATALSLGATVDIVIAVSMCYCLWQLRHSMFQRCVGVRRDVAIPVVSICLSISSTRLMADLIMAWSIGSCLGPLTSNDFYRRANY
jgi:hypothetical protein